MLVLTSVLIFCAERQYLVSEPRGATVSKYKDVSWIDKVLLLVEDFEGLSKDSLIAPEEKFFSFGSAKISPDQSSPDNTPLSSTSALLVEWTGTDA